MKIGLDQNGVPITQKSNLKHAAILNMAIAIAASEGLEALTTGRLASCLNISRSGVFSHFHSKEDLQLKVLDWAYDLFYREVIAPAYERGPGALSIKCFIDGLHRYHSDNCFLTHISSEFDSKEGAVKEKIVELHHKLSSHLCTMIWSAIKASELSSRSDEEIWQTVFLILALFMGSQILCQLGVVENAAPLRRRQLAQCFSPFITNQTPDEFLKWLA